MFLNFFISGVQSFESKQDFVVLPESALKEFLVCAKKPVHDAIRPVVSVEKAVMEVVELRAVKQRQVQAAVLEVGCDDDEQIKDESSRHFGSENQEAADGQNIAKQMFEGMAVLGGEGDRGDPLVMNLVNVFVKHFVMQQSVVAVENHFVDRGTSNHVDHQLPE